MRLVVTALGSTGGRGVDAVVAAIRHYLLGPRTTPANGAPDGPRPGPEDPVRRYYADSGDGPGRWLGHGAGELNLAGTIDPKDFTMVLSGRHPRTGERLISARGSAGRVGTLGVGTAARWGPDGEPLYSPEDVAAILGWTRSEVHDALDDGEHYAATALLHALAGGPERHDAARSVPDRDRDPGFVLVPFVAADGDRYVCDREVARVERLLDSPPTGDQILSTGHPDDELTVPAAARLVGMSRSYLSRLCRAYLEHRDDIQATVSRGELPRRAHVVCRRDEGGYRITRRDLAGYTERRRRPAVRVGYDVTATTEKSISVLALLGDSRMRREALAAVQIANDCGLAWLERHAAAARAGGQTIGVTGWTVASFRHLTSRRLDPFVHHHNVVANTVLDERGQRRALDARPLYRSVAAASALATAQVRYELTARLGVAWRPGRRGGWEIAGIDDPVLDEFSQRTREIRDTIRELEEALGRTTSLDELRTVVATTRPAKQAIDNESTLLAHWCDRATALGLTPGDLHQCLGRARPTRVTPQLEARVLRAAERAVTAERSVFTRADALATLVDLPLPGGTGPLIVPAARLEQLADQLLASNRVVPLARTTGRSDTLHRHDGTTLAVGGDPEPEYTTTEMLTIQARILHRYQSLRSAETGTVPAPLVDHTLARFPELSAEQRALVATFCTSGHGAQSAIGRPGTGKTHTMRAAVTAWEAASYRVLGTAVKAEAARHLGRHCHIPAEPLAWYLNRIDDPLHTPLDQRTILIVDEASTLGDRALDRLLAAAEATGATLRFIGDPAQHGSITAGGMWRLLTARSPDHTPELTIGQRVRHQADQAAAEALREGRVADALAALDAAGHLHVSRDERDLYASMLTRWWHQRQAGHPHPMVDRRNDQRLVLNRLARRLRQHMGELGTVEIAAAGDRRFAVGDDVVARMGDRRLHPTDRPANYVRNGAHGTITAVHPTPDPAHDRITVDFADLGVIDLPRSFFDEHQDPWGRVDVGLDHAYAITSFAVEGQTYHQSSSHVDPRSSRPEVYVDITRGRDANHIFLTRAEDHLDGERLPAPPPDPERRQLEDRLARSGPEPAALELDPLAIDAAHYAHGKTLAQLTRERLAATEPTHAALIAHAERIREQQIARQARARPDPHLTARLGPRPLEAHLAKLYDELIGDIAIYRARWRPHPGQDGPVDVVLGQPVDHPQGRLDHENLAERFAGTISASEPDGGQDGETHARRHHPLREHDQRARPIPSIGLTADGDTLPPPAPGVTVE